MMIRSLSSHIWIALIAAFILCDSLSKANIESNTGKSSSCQKLKPKKRKSQHLSDTEINITITNVGEETMELYWIDYTGSEVLIDTLEKDETTDFSTFPGHVWRANLQTTGETNFEQIITHTDHNTLIPIGFGCHKSVVDLNFTNYLFKTVSDIQLIPNPELVLSQIEKSPCNNIGLKEWINKYVAAPGYHVVCMTRSSHSGVATNKDSSWRISIEAWRDGYDVINQNSGQTFTGTSYSDFRKHIEALLLENSVHTDSFLELTRSEILRIKTSGATSRSTNNWEYLPQPWALFTTDRKRIENMQDLNSLFQRPSNSFLSLFLPHQTPVIVLVMEGGQFVYPGIDLGFTRVVQTHDKTIELETLSMRPLIFRMNDFLFPEEILKIIETSAPEMKASPVSLMDKDVGKSATEFRTSQQYFLSSKGSNLLENLEQRVAELSGCPRNQQETLQVLKYQKGQYYLPHLDYWDPVYYQSPAEVLRSHAGHKNRLSTVFWYLSDCEGGHTAFPLAPTHLTHVSQILPEPSADPNRYYFTTNSRENHIAHTLSCEYGLRIPPKVGSAVLFYSLLPNGLGDSFSQHAACAVQGGVKWAANKWIWNKQT